MNVVRECYVIISNLFLRGKAKMSWGVTIKVGVNCRGVCPPLVLRNEALKQVMKHMHIKLKPDLILLLTKPGNKAMRCCSVIVHVNPEVL